MKKRVLLGGLLALAVVGCALLPRMVKSSIPAAYYITPNLKTYENVISCTGTVQSENVQQICMSSALVAKEVLVAVGDVVKEGDPLVNVDLEETQRLALPLRLLQEFTGDAAGASQADWASLAASYGLSSVVDGAPGALNSDAVEALLKDSGLLDSGEFQSAVGKIEGETVSAPLSGVVTSVDIQTGVPAPAGNPIVTLSDNERYKVVVAVREEDVSRVRVGDAAKVRGVGFGGATYYGSVTKVYPMARKALSGTTTETVVDAEITLENPDKRLKPGFTAKVEIHGGDDYDLVTVPYEAIKQDENNNEYVYLYEGGKLRKQIVVTGQELTNEVEIIDGISRDSVVVYNPSDDVREGAMIHLKGRANVD